MNVARASCQSAPTRRTYNSTPGLPAARRPEVAERAQLLMRRLLCWIFHRKYRTKYNRYVGYYLTCSKCGDAWE